MTQRLFAERTDFESMFFDAAGFVAEMEKSIDAGDQDTIALNVETLNKLIEDMADQRSRLTAMETRARALYARAMAATTK